MNQPNLDAEMGLEAYSSNSPGDWITGVLGRLRDSPKWTAAEIEIGGEDDSGSERISLVHGRQLDPTFKTLLSSSSQCSCFLTVDDATGAWRLPTMATSEGQNTTLTASVYDADLRSHGTTWTRIGSLLELCFDLLLDETTEWLRFGVEGAEISSPEWSVFVILSETLWGRVPEKTRVLLSPVVEERPGFRVVWCSPQPGSNSPEDFPALFSSVVSVIVSE